MTRRKSEWRRRSQVAGEAEFVSPDFLFFLCPGIRRRGRRKGKGKGRREELNRKSR